MQSFNGPYDAYVGFDVGKLSHRACCVLAGGAVAFNVGVANDEAAIDRVLAEAAAHGRALAVVDQRRNIGTTVVRRAREAGVEDAYLPGIAANSASALFPGDAKTDKRDAEVIADGHGRTPGAQAGAGGGRARGRPQARGAALRPAARPNALRQQAQGAAARVEPGLRARARLRGGVGALARVARRRPVAAPRRREEALGGAHARKSGAKGA